MIPNVSFGRALWATVAAALASLMLMASIGLHSACQLGMGNSRFWLWRRCCRWG